MYCEEALQHGLDVVASRRDRLTNNHVMVVGRVENDYFCYSAEILGLNPQMLHDSFKVTHLVLPSGKIIYA